MGRSKQLPQFRRQISLFAAVAMLVSALPVVAAVGEARALQLAVTVNSVPLNQIAAFTLADDGSLLSTRGELTDIGVKVPGVGPALTFPG